MSTTVSPTPITEHEAAQVERANATKATPVVFVHGLWLLPSSWDRWVTLFEEAGYVALTPGWPDDPETVAEAKAHPEVFAGKGIGEIADYEEAIIRRLDRKPVDHRPLVRRPADYDSRRARARRRVGRDQPCSVPRRAPAADLGAAHGERRPAQPRELEPRGPAHATSSSATASRTRSARTRRRSCTSATPSRRPASRSSRRRPRTSIRGQRRRSTRRTPSGGRC